MARFFITKYKVSNFEHIGGWNTIHADENNIRTKLP